MGIFLKGSLLLVVFFSTGTFEANGGTALDGTKLLSTDYFSSISTVSKKSEVYQGTELREEYIAFIRSSSASERDAPKIKSCSDSSGKFPHIFTTDDLKSGGIAVVIFVGIYCFTILAVICDRYFLPCMEVLCETLNLSYDVAAATFMSIATSTPELFVNIIGTFITKSDLGVGTIVGSSLFNTLGVAAIGSLAAAEPIQLDWWPLTRDTIIYMSAVCLLITITYDKIIFWFEGLILFVVYFFYFTLMFNNKRIWKIIENYLPNKKAIHAEDAYCRTTEEDRTIDSKKISTSSPYGSYMEDVQCLSVKSRDKVSSVLDNKEEPPSTEVTTICAYGSYIEDAHHTHISNIIDENNNALQIIDSGNSMRTSGDQMSVTQEEGKQSVWSKFLWTYTFPIKLVLRYTIPDPRKYPKLFPVTFIMCIVFIGVNSYIVSWMITLIGSLLKIPDAVLGFTFLAAGGCLPETISITIMSRRGEGSMGVSNSLGANTMNILMSLGLPWFIKTILMGIDDTSFINIDSGAMEYIIMGLLLAAIALYSTLYFNKFQLRRRGGIILCAVYLLFVTISIAAEMLTSGC